MLDGKAFGEEMTAIVKGFVERATAPLIQRLAVLEARPAPEKGEQGDRGDSGEIGPAGCDGVGVRDSFLQRDGVLVLTLTDGTTRDLGVVVGKDGEPGLNGDAGECGEPGEKGERGEPGLAGERGEKGVDGRDGAGITDLMVDKDGGLVATLDDGRNKLLGRVAGKDGKDGRDGFGLEDFDVEAGEDGRTVTLKFQQGDVRHAYELVFPVVIDRGVFKAEREEPYMPGDGVTWGGSYWIAQRETKAKPDIADSGWRLSVKKGRDGKDAK